MVSFFELLVIGFIVKAILMLNFWDNFFDSK